MDPSFFERVRTCVKWSERVFSKPYPPFQTTVEILRAVFTREDIVKRPNQPNNMGR